MSDDDREARQTAFEGGFDKAKYGFNRQSLADIGERKIRDSLNLGKYGGPGDKHYIYVTAWLADIDFARSRAEPVVDNVVKNVAEQVRKEPAPDHWYKKPVPVIALAVTAAIIVLGLRYMLKHKFGLDL